MAKAFSSKSAKNVGMIAALIAKNRAIGKGNELLVRISDDLKRFRGLTTGNTVIMGRKTYESIGRPLPNRENIVITRSPAFKAEGIIVASSVEEALNKASSEKIFIIGGGEIYAQALPFADKLYLTLVESDLEGDVLFPDYGDFKKILNREDRIDEKTGLKYSWIDLER